MLRLRKLHLALIAVPALGSPMASAADLDDNYEYAEPAAPEAKIQFGSGWYVRGDLGAARGLGISAGDEPYDTTLFQQHPAIAAGTNPITGATTSAVPASYYPRGIFEGPGSTAPAAVTSHGAVNYTASLGAGYQFNRWFRADLIADFHQPNQSSALGQGRPCVTGTVGVGTAPYQYEDLVSTTCTPTLSAKLKSYDVLVNGYVDIGTWHAVTPYVGAGVGLGFGYASTSAQYVMGNNQPYNISYTDVLNGASYYQNWDRTASRQYYNFAFAFMGGFAIDVYEHTKLDIGYRYLHLGDVLGVELATHEVRAGLRYMIDN